jgi:Uma2 family endonuclease
MTLQTTDASDLYYYYDSHLTPEDLMGETTAHSQLIRYLIAVLEWQFRVERWFVGDNLNLYHTGKRDEPPIVPDIAVFQGCVLSPPPARPPRSWRIRPPENPPPTVVFEIGSEATREMDVRNKPGVYATRGVREYFYYDPEDVRLNPAAPMQGWRMERGLAVPMDLTDRGWLWSDQLESWLVPDGRWLRLYDRLEQQRLTGEEAAARQAEFEAERARQEEERARREADNARREAENARREAENAAHQAERAEAERAAKERAWARLRELGVDPETA